MNETINLDHWKVLVKRKRLIGLILGGTLIVSICVSLLLPKIYASTTTLLPPQQESSVGMAGMAASQLSGSLGGLAGSFLGSKSPADVWVAILKSGTVRDAMISRFDLMKVFNVTSEESARKLLNEMVRIGKSKEDIVSITVEDTDPQRAAVLANAFVEELDKVNKRVVMTSGGRMRTFIEKRLNDQKIELVKIEEEVKAFQERNGAVKLDDQSKAVIDVIGRVKGQLMAKEIELQTLLSFATPNNPQAELLKSQVDELYGSLKELEEGKKGGGVSRSIFIPTAKIPDLILQYARLLRDAKVQETLYGLLTQQYEMSRIQEAKDSPTVQVLDVAKVPESWIRPKRKQIVLISLFTAVFSSIFVSFFMEYVDQFRFVRTRSGRSESRDTFSEMEEEIQTVEIGRQQD
ncbi:MAG: Wzz/FepE/Etk N-terminal domain-containing protein [Candidatus Manganitrophus sp. SA1]|nr:Wzz/FepE/Etk N-terminal domain-containing protein [Candidatus Manganitrophus morganii]